MQAERSRPRVSIGMPVYNGESFLVGALDSLLAQTTRDFELIISDNGSTDRTEQICLEAATSDNRIKYVRQETPLSLQANFNFVLAQAKAPFFMWAAHDDRWHPQYVETLSKAIDANPRAVLAFGKWENLKEDGTRCQAFRPVDWQTVFSGEKAKQFECLALIDGGTTQKGNHVYGLMRTQALRKVGGMPAAPVSRGGGEDIQLLLRLLCEGEFEIVDRVLFYYRIKSLPPRPRGKLMSYAWRRMFGWSSGHGGNLALAFRGKHFDHAARRSIIWREAPLSWRKRATIWARLCIVEVHMLLLVLPKNAIAQLRSVPTS